MTTTLVDRVVQWNLDLDGDLYGDERERFRWYEGMAAASMLQSLLIPWAAAVMVWPLGPHAVLPLAVMLAATWVPQLLSTVYVHRRQVDTTPRGWSSKRILLFVAGVVPYAGFVVGAAYVFDPAGSTWKGAAVGGAIGAIAGLVGMLVKSRRRAREEALASDDV